MRRFGTGFVALPLWHSAGAAHAAPCDTSGADLVVDGITCELGGVYSFGSVQVINGGVIDVPSYDGVAPVNTGNLELRATSILVEAGSTITAQGQGIPDGTVRFRCCSDSAP